MSIIHVSSFSNPIRSDGSLGSLSLANIHSSKQWKYVTKFSDMYTMVTECLQATDMWNARLFAGQQTSPFRLKAMYAKHMHAFSTIGLWHWLSKASTPNNDEISNHVWCIVKWSICCGAGGAGLTLQCDHTHQICIFRIEWILVSFIDLWLDILNYSFTQHFAHDRAACKIHINRCLIILFELMMVRMVRSRFFCIGQKSSNSYGWCPTTPPKSIKANTGWCGKWLVTNIPYCTKRLGPKFFLLPHTLWLIYLLAFWIFHFACA